MGIPIIVEPVSGDRYRATGAGGLSIGLIAEGSSAAEAIDRLADQVRIRGAPERSWPSWTSPLVRTPMRGPKQTRPRGSRTRVIRDDPLYKPWRAAMEEYRRQLDEDPEAL